MPRGGHRPGAGRPKKKPNDQPKRPPADPPAEPENLSPLDYMLRVMRDPNEDKRRRDQMAAWAAPYCHRKAGEPGKKEEKQDRAKAAATGKFSPMPAPVLPFKRKP